MNSEEFKEYIKDKEDKIASFKDVLKQLEFPVKDLIQVFSDILSDEEKFQFINRFKKLDVISKMTLIKSIKSSKIKLNIIKNEELTEGFIASNYLDLIRESLDDAEKVELLSDKGFFEKRNIVLRDIHIFGIVNNMKNDENKIPLLYDKKFLDLYDLNNKRFCYDVICNIKQKNLVDKLIEDEEHLKIWSMNEDDFIGDIVQRCSDEKKKEIILSGKYNFNRYRINDILYSFDIQNLIDFMKENMKFLKDKNIKPYEIIIRLPEDEQFQFITSMEEIGLELEEKLKILITLEKEVKDKIDITNMNDRYVQALQMTIDKDSDKFVYGGIELDLDGDLEKYRGLDDLIKIKPQNIPIEKHGKLLELARICPGLKVYDNLDMVSSTGQEFINTEEWIRDILENIQDSWSDIQKIAYIDYRIGKRISYSPDFDTEVSDDESARALWKIGNSGYGVCNGIAQLEQYILSHEGIEAEKVGSDDHSFLKLKNIEIPREDGTKVKGDTILDGTWNLAAHRYDAYPRCLARSYEEIRKLDVSPKGHDEKCHENDEALSSATIEIEESVLRKIYGSIGLAKEDGNFPISDMTKESDEIAIKDIPIEQKVEEQLDLLKRTHPDFDRCQNSTMAILEGNLLNYEEMKCEKVVVDRVYNKKDENKRPAVYIYYKLNEERQIFFVAEEGSGTFVKMDKEEFIKVFECYDEDLRRQEGVRPWEERFRQEEQDLSKSSGNVDNLAKEIKGDER